MAGERQSVPARHGIATFVPKGHSIKIINTYGTQVIDTWVFALHKPPNEESEADEKAEEEAINQAQQEAEKEVDTHQVPPIDDGNAVGSAPGASAKKDDPVDKSKTPAKDDTEAPQATAGAEAPPATTAKPATEMVDGRKVRTWASYVPSVPSVAALRARRKASSTTQGKEVSSASNEPAPEDVSKKQGVDKNQNQEAVDNRPEKSGDQTTEQSGPAQVEGDVVKVAGTATPSDKSEDDYVDAKSVQSSKSWGSYLPSIRSRAKAAYGGDKKIDTESKESKGNTKSWLSYLPSGTSFTSYLPNSGKEALSAFAASHHRDPTKSYAEQLYEFSKTPVGAASLSAATGSGTAGSLYAAYTAYTKLQASQRHTGPMEYLSLPHTIDATHNLCPAPGDTLLSNLHGPLLTLLEDTSPPATTTDANDTDAVPLRHGTVLPACDPTTYKELAATAATEEEDDGDSSPPPGEEHGSCAENLVLALQEFNKRTGLKGARTVGADVTINSAPVPLALFMNATVDPASGQVAVREPRRYGGGRWGAGGEKGGFVRLRAERDVVVVMSACPMDAGPRNGGRSMAANFVVEEPDGEEKEEEGGERKGEERGERKKEKKQDTTSEKISAQKKELKKAAPKKEVKKTAAPVEKEKRRDSVHGAGGGLAKPTKPTVERAKSMGSGLQKKPTVERAKSMGSGVQTPKTETSTTSNEPFRNAPKPGRKRPKKLDRRNSSKAPA